jgi:hypothetical protein
MFFFEFLNVVNPAYCWIFAGFLDVAWLVAVDADLSYSSIVDLTTHHWQELRNILFGCHFCRQISSSNCILAVVFIIAFEFVGFFFQRRKWLAKF